MSGSTPVLAGCEQWMSEQEKGIEPPCEGGDQVASLTAKVKETSLDTDSNALCEKNRKVR